jgi:hypothetical protein
MQRWRHTGAMLPLRGAIASAVYAASRALSCDAGGRMRVRPGVVCTMATSALHCAICKRTSARNARAARVRNPVFKALRFLG